MSAVGIAIVNCKEHIKRFWCIKVLLHERVWIRVTCEGSWSILALDALEAYLTLKEALRAIGDAKCPVIYLVSTLASGLSRHDVGNTSRRVAITHFA